MHNVFRLPEKRHRVVDHLSTEVDAIAAARNVAMGIADIAKQSSQARSEFAKHMATVSRAGLLGISVPADHGGADIANAVLAEIVSVLSESDPHLGVSLKRHFQVVEAIRLFASQGQQAVYFAHALAGEHFALAIIVNATGENSNPLPNLLSDRTGFCLKGPEEGQVQAALIATVSDVCDWVSVPALDDKGQHVLALLAREAEELSLKRLPDPESATDCAEMRLDLSDCHVQADACVKIATGPDGLSTLKPLGKLLQGAVDLGIARAIFADLQHHLGRARDIDSGIHATVGRLYARIEGAAALIERAGQKLDVAQVNSTHEAVLDAFLSASAAVVLATEVVRDVRAKCLDIATLANPSQTLLQACESPAVEDQRSTGVLGRFLTDGTLPALSPFG